MELSSAPVCVFQKRMERSAVPPPDASRLDWKGHQASAFTAAVCAVSLRPACKTLSHPRSQTTCALSPPKMEAAVVGTPSLHRGVLP